MTPLDTSLRTASFKNIASRKDLAEWLGISDKRLRYLLYAVSDGERYRSFTIKKRNGGDRKIDAPHSFLKMLQRRVADVLYDVSAPRFIAKGYVPGLSIVDMARLHRSSRWVVAIDLKDFFPCINFGRVRGLFMAAPFSFPNEAATAIAQLCTFQGALAQGAPSSPAISNIICRKLDRLLVTFAKRHHVKVSRYADDIVFSFNFMEVPKFIACEHDGEWKASDELNRLVKSCGFTLNAKKTRVMHRSQRQLVTGLVVNKKPQMPREWRRLNRSILNVIRKYGDEEAARILSAWTVLDGDVPSATALIKGRTSFSSHLDKVFKSRHSASLRAAFPAQATFVNYNPEYRTIEVITEGKTDRILLEYFYRKVRVLPEYQDVRLSFPIINERDGFGEGALTKRLDALVNSGVRTLTVGLFDADSQLVASKYKIQPGECQRVSLASDFVYAAILPFPPGIVGEFCIEHYFPRDFVLRVDNAGRRLFYRDEFDERTGRHLDMNVYCRSEKKTLIVDDGVYDMHGVNMAISKAVFAQSVASNVEPWADANVEWFFPVFDMLKDLAVS